MKKLTRIIALISLIIAFFILVVTPAVMADTISAGDYVRLVAYNPVDNAGIMIYDVTHDGGIGGSYDVAFEYATFCIQEHVYTWKNIWFEVASVSDTVGYYGAKTQLNGAVDYLFYLYKSGAYNAYMNDLAQQADLQNLLWDLQEGINPETLTGGEAWRKDMEEYYDNTGLQHSWGTKVINIVTSDGKDIQNQLYIPVPEPATILLLGFGLVGLAVSRKKIQK